jgi:hypothetical protein
MSDTDLQQYNGTPLWIPTADFETAADQYLIPTDGNVVSADSNLPGDAPINRAARDLKDRIDGLRAAIFGDVGAIRKTVYSLRIDGVGGQNNAASPGEVAADGEIRTILGDFKASLGKLLLNDSAAYAEVGQAPAGYLRLFSTALQWFITGTGATDANPPYGTALPNRLTAKAVLKHYARVASQAGAINLFDGLGNWVVTLVDTGMGSPARYRFRFTLPTPFADALYAVQATWFGPNSGSPAQPVVMTDTLTAGRFDIAFYVYGIGWLDISSQDAQVAVCAYGQQNT